jgi:hypothetical protein
MTGKTLAIHPWSTTHEQLSDAEKEDSGVTEVCFASPFASLQCYYNIPGCHIIRCSHLPFADDFLGPNPDLSRYGAY